MKKTILTIFAILCVISMIQECSCGGKKNDNADQGPATIREAIIANDFEACNRMLEDLYNYKVIGNATFAGTSMIYDEYIPQAIQVLKAEASYLMDMQNPDAERLFMLCFNDVSGKLGEFRYGEKKTKGPDYNNDQYMSCATSLNGCLITIIKEALIKDNLSFAEKVEKLVLVSIKADKKTNGTFEEDDYTYTFDRSAQKMAKELIRDYKNSH